MNNPEKLEAQDEDKESKTKNTTQYVLNITSTHNVNKTKVPLQTNTNVVHYIVERTPIKMHVLMKMGKQFKYAVPILVSQVLYTCINYIFYVFQHASLHINSAIQNHINLNQADEKRCYLIFSLNKEHFQKNRKTVSCKCIIDLSMPS